MSKRHYGTKVHPVRKNKSKIKLKQFDVGISATNLLEASIQSKSTLKETTKNENSKVSNFNKKHSDQHSKHKLVQFNTCVDIFEVSDTWKIHIRNESLKSENEQQARNKKLKEIYLPSNIQAKKGVQLV